MATLKEKIGYGFGDMSSSMFWKIFSYYLPIFYSNIYGLSLADTGVLLLVTRIWDAALQLLRRWIYANKQLMVELKEAGYNKNRHSYLPLEVKLIFKYLGEP